MRLLELFRRATDSFALGLVGATKHVSPIRLPHWRAGLDKRTSLADVRARLEDVARTAGRACNVKGHPDIAGIKRAFAEKVQHSLAVGGPTLAIKPAHRMAALDMRDARIYQLYLDVLGLANCHTLSSLRRALKRHVVVHLSCAGRLTRAQESMLSFESAEKDGVSQLIVVGTGSSQVFDYDSNNRILTVPALDAYEHLPTKFVTAIVALVLAGGVESVLKVDDDHRLNKSALLSHEFRRVRSASPVQMGRPIDVGILGNHARTWHFGKTRDPELSQSPFSLPGTTRWINGACGYFLNEQAMRLLLWSHVYFSDYLRAGLYEDITISDLIERQGGRLKIAPMEDVLSVVNDY